jgi:hypothetical protein
MGWATRKQNITEAETLTSKFGASKEDAQLVIKFVAEECYSPEEFARLLKELKVKNYPETHLDLAS